MNEDKLFAGSLCCFGIFAIFCNWPILGIFFTFFGAAWLLEEEDER
jgi:hypothetical protein